MAEAIGAVAPVCLGYVVHISRQAPGANAMCEVWADRAALAVRNQAPALTSLAARFDERLAEPLRLEPPRRIA